MYKAIRTIILLSAIFLIAACAEDSTGDTSGSLLYTGQWEVRYYDRVTVYENGEELEYPDRIHDIDISDLPGDTLLIEALTGGSDNELSGKWLIKKYSLVAAGGLNGVIDSIKFYSILNWTGICKIIYPKSTSYFKIEVYKKI